MISHILIIENKFNNILCSKNIGVRFDNCFLIFVQPRLQGLSGEIYIIVIFLSTFKELSRTKLILFRTESDIVHVERYGDRRRGGGDI